MSSLDAEPRIWLMRHAQSEWNASRRWQGRADPPLSVEGRRAAVDRAPDLAKELTARRAPLRVFCSDLRRARETAEIVAGRLDLEPVWVPGLRELDVGSWSGLTREEIAERDAQRLAAFDTGDPAARPGGGETRAELRVRTRAAVVEIAAAHPDCDLLLVVHLGVVRALVPGAEPGNLGLVWTGLAAIEAL